MLLLFPSASSHPLLVSPLHLLSSTSFNIDYNKNPLKCVCTQKSEFEGAKKCKILEAAQGCKEVFKASLKAMQ